MILLRYISQFFKTRMIYRADFVTELFTFGLGLFFQLAYLWLLFQKTSSFEGWQPAQVIFIWGAAMVPNGLFDVIAPNIFMFSEKHINQGGLDRILLRPLPVLPQIFMEHFRFGALTQSLVGLVMMTQAGTHFGWEWTTERALSFAFFALCGASLITSVFIMIATVSFWSQDRLGIGAPIWNMLHFGRWPIKIFNPFVQFVLTWVLPFAFIGYFPATVLLDIDSHLPLSPLILIPAMAAFFIFLALLFWSRGLKAYTSVGA